MRAALPGGQFPCGAGSFVRVEKTHTVESEGAAWEPLGPAVIRRRLPGWDATVGAVAGADAVLLIDTGSSLHEGAAVRREVTALFGARVTHVALTHPHFDHVLGTAAFAGVRVYGAVGTDALLAPGARAREALLSDALAHGLDAEAAAEAVDVLVAPEHTVTDRLTIDLGGRTAHLVDVGPGHTAHDLAVLVPHGAGERSVVFCGDLVEESAEPQAGADAQPARWPEALDRLLGLGGPGAIYVPGHGAVVDAAFVAAQRDALARRFG